ncbi:hypothetical protein FRC12_025103 [Ceratobasidium sp. 428]|nr:hypothetical protein FRC12_025103 [Ceratobasidium sp. 428]
MPSLNWYKLCVRTVAKEETRGYAAHACKGGMGGPASNEQVAQVDVGYNLGWFCDTQASTPKVNSGRRCALKLLDQVLHIFAPARRHVRGRCLESKSEICSSSRLD